MACGEEAPWRNQKFLDDLESLTDRYMRTNGLLEHLLVQFDLVKQEQLNARMEYSIPNASWQLKKSGKTGFADIVSLSKKFIWEIKPEDAKPNYYGKDGNEQAVKKAEWYVKFANENCGKGWKLGTGYSTILGGGVVWIYPNISQSVKLMAKQGSAGAILYYWEIDGIKVLIETFVKQSIYEEVIKKIKEEKFPKVPVPIPINSPPVPVKWKPPQPPAGIHPAFGRSGTRIGNAIHQMILTSYFRLIPEGCAIAVAMEIGAFVEILGPAIKQNQKERFEVKSDPTVALYRKTLFILTSSVGITGIVGLAIGGWWLAGEVIALAPTVIAIVFKFSVTEGGVAAASVTEMGLLAALRQSLNNSAIAKLLVADGAFMLGFILPRAANASSDTPVSGEVCIPLVKLLSPSEANSVKVGETLQIDGKQSIIIALLGTGPD